MAYEFVSHITGNHRILDMELYFNKLQSSMPLFGNGHVYFILLPSPALSGFKERWTIPGNSVSFPVDISQLPSH